MVSEKVKSFLTIYFAVIMPALLMVLAILYDSGVMWFLLFMVWICAGIMIVFLPSNPEINSG